MIAGGASTRPEATNGAGGTDGSPPDANHERKAGLDALLTDAAGGGGSRFFPGMAAAQFAGNLATRPQKVARRGLGLAAELGKVALGRSEVAPPKGDKRFADPAWKGNPAFRRLAQSYLALGTALEGLIDDAELDWRGERKVRFALENLHDALAPTNFPITNPAALKAALDTGGGNFARGARHLVRDLRRPPRVPAMVDGSVFEVGENLAVTPGDVVARTPVFELLHYRPSTPQVREVPLLVVPPMINKYYVADLTPGRSMIEYLVGEGQQVFAISWRNPDERHADWSLDTYAHAVIEALDAARAITRSPTAHALGLCAGGITLSVAASHLAATDRLDRIAGLTLGVTVIDQERASTTAAFVDRELADSAIADSYRRGYLDGRSLAGVFAWLRPNDLVWNYWVNNYLLGKDPPAFDILYWNADTTNMPAALHRDFIEMALENALVRPGARSVLGTPIDLRSITVDTYLVAGISDHITPWESCYRTTQLLGSQPRFVLSTSGHIAAMVNPPSNPKASYRTAPATPPDPEAWMAAAATQPGTWWTDWAGWLGERSGEEKPAPKATGSEDFNPLGPAPGTYVHDTVHD